MGLKKVFALPFARKVRKKLLRKATNAEAIQLKVLKDLILNGARTDYGKDHNLEVGMSYEEFTTHIPIRDYEAFRPYIEKVKNNKADVLWTGRPDYLCKTSGTTSGDSST